MLETLSKLLNQAENAATDAEAEAFFAKAQQLATLHAISLAEARAHTQRSQRREEPTHEQLTIGQPRQHVNSHLCLLSVAIGEANSLRTNIASNNTFIIWFGLPSDIEAATMLLHSVAHQMVRSADAFVRARTWVDERDLENLGAPMTAQKARKSYYSAYVRVIGERLLAARKDAETEYDRTSEGTAAALVLRGKEIEVRDYYDEASRARGSWRGNRSSFSSQAAVRRARVGRAAGGSHPSAGDRGHPSGRGIVNTTRRLYDAENTLLFMLANGGTVQFLGSSLTLPVERRFGDVHGVRRYLHEIRRRPWGYPDVPEPLVRVRKGHAKAHWENGTIALPDGIGDKGWAMREVVVLHEYAHHVTWHVHADTGHGDPFREVYLGLLDAAVGPEASLIVRAGLHDS